MERGGMVGIFDVIFCRYRYRNNRATLCAMQRKTEIVLGFFVVLFRSLFYDDLMAQPKSGSKWEKKSFSLRRISFLFTISKLVWRWRFHFFCVWLMEHFLATICGRANEYQIARMSKIESNFSHRTAKTEPLKFISSEWLIYSIFLKW